MASLDTKENGASRRQSASESLLADADLENVGRQSDSEIRCKVGNNNTNTSPRLKNTKIQGHKFAPTSQSKEKNLGTDIRNRFRLYASDFTDALNLQCLPSTFYVFFANLVPVVTFSAMIQASTDSQIGSIESLLGMGLCGTFWALLSGQPLVIITMTGPMLIFDRILFRLSQQFQIEYLGFRLLVGAWTFVLICLCVGFRVSRFVKYITGFTQECFAALISLVITIDGVRKIFYWPAALAPDWPSKNENEINRTGNCSSFQDNCETILGRNFNFDVALTNGCVDQNFHAFYEACADNRGYYGVLLSMMTLTICVICKYSTKVLPFLPKVVLKQLTDFGVILSIVIGTAVDQSREHGPVTEKLEIPHVIGTTSDRAWLVSLPSDHLPLLLAASVLPALVLTVLVFLDQQITTTIVNRKSNKLSKPVGYHLDLLVVGILVLVCSIFGFPLYVAGTVQSVAHVQSLRVYGGSDRKALKRQDSDNSNETRLSGSHGDIAIGDIEVVVDSSSDDRCQSPDSVLLGCIEQRVTGLFVYLLTAGSILATRVLTLVPMSVLYGVFVYLGVAIMVDLSVFKRFLLLFSSVSRRESEIFRKYESLSGGRRISQKTVVTFTILQVLCIVFLYLVNAIKVTSIGFPLMILVVGYVRLQMRRFYDDRDLALLESN